HPANLCLSQRTYLPLGRGLDWPFSLESFLPLERRQGVWAHSIMLLGSGPTAQHPWGIQRLVELCPVASPSAGDSASSAPANRWGRRLASSTPKLCSCHWGGEPAASFFIPSSGCWDDMSVVLSPRCMDLCWGGKTTSSTLANCWGGTTNTSSPFSPCILICCWVVTTSFSP
ncbi:hypothetical protein AB205_0013550, partial [Aquarana catesbeiana]